MTMRQTNRARAGVFPMSDIRMTRGRGVRWGGRRKGAPIARRMVDCAFCDARIPLALALKTRGLCEKCRGEGGLGWRPVFDRDDGSGAVPDNLRRAYGLDEHGRQKG